MRGRGPNASSLSLSLTERQALAWLDEQLFPGTGHTDLVLTARIAGALDLGRLVGAWRQCVGEFDAFQIQIDRAQPRQSWRTDAAVPLAVVRLDGEDQLAAWMGARLAAPLWGSRDTWEAAVLVLPGEQYLLFVRAHQTVADSASLIHLLEALAARYEGQPPAKHLGLHEYRALRDAYSDSDEQRADRAYWEAKLARSVPALRLYGQPRASGSPAAKRHRADLSPETERRLRALAAQPRFESPDRSAPTLLLITAAFASFLARVAGAREVVMALLLADRPGAFASSVGPFQRQLLVRAEVDDEDTLATLAARLGEEARASMVHGRYSVPARGTEALTLDLLPPLPTRFAGLPLVAEVGPETLFAGSASAAPGPPRHTFAMQAHAPAPGNDGDGGSIWLDFHVATFPTELQRQAAAHFVRVLSALVADPDGARVGAIDLLDEGERQAALREARGPDRPDEAPDLVAKLADTTSRRRDARAVEASDASLTFGELDAVTSALARRLRSLGVGRDTRVGISLPRGAIELVAMLATLRAGGAYVPLDRSYPIDRLRSIVEDAAPQLIVTYPSSPLAATGATATPALLLLEDIPQAIAGWDGPALDIPVDPDQCAYVLFTSGSTGRPKGVAIPRRALANFLHSMAHTPGMAEGERLLAVTTTSFDIAGLELFLPLWVGATTVIADRDTAVDPKRLRQKLETSSIDVMQATPATWRLLLEAGWRGDGRLRKLCGGEAMSPELATRLLATGPELWNMYGPTETTIWSTLDRVTSRDKRISIGRPIDRTQVHVLDRRLNPVPVGVVGELYIGGEGLALGYLGRDDLTAERFVQNPHGPPGDRLYRVGDLGRRLADGRLECLGRVDDQVKIRGFRIEIGEVESVLRAVSGVDEAVVVADSDGGGDPRLLVYWAGPAARDALFEAARRKLPAYMVPSAFTRLDEFPLGPTGKIDRRRLPLPAAKDERAPGRTPATPIEARIASVWQMILGVDAIGTEHDFFALGGTSIQAIEVCTCMEQELGVEVPVRLFFESPTIAGLAARLGDAVSADDPIVVKLVGGPDTRPPLFCLLGLSIYRELALALDGTRSVVGIHVPHRYVPGRDPRPALRDVAATYVQQIRRQQARGPYHLAGLCFGGIIAYEAARQLEAAGEQVAVVAILDAILPRAVHVNQVQRLRSVLSDPQRRAARVRGTLREMARTWLVRLPIVRRAITSLSGGQPASAIDLPFDGPEVDAEIRKVSSQFTRIDGRLVIVRATGEPTPAWVETAPDLGWSGLAARLFLHDMSVRHLELLEAPHVARVAAAIESALASAVGGAAAPPPRAAPPSGHAPNVHASGA